MKTLKFQPHLIPLILSGTKTVTWRINDDKNLIKGDIIQFVNSDTFEKFAVATINKVLLKQFKQLNDEDWSGHEKFPDTKSMYDHYSLIYKTDITPDTLVKIIWFDLIP